MNILLINHYAGGPAYGMEFRPYYFAREWVRQGHRVEVVACSHSHVRARQPEMGGQVERRESIDGIDWRWLHAPAYRGNGWRRLLNITVFLARLWSRSKTIVRERKPDLVIASSTYPMDIWVAQRIARLAGCPWVYEVHDLWPQSLIELSGMSPGHPFVMLCDWAERHAYVHADAVVSMLPCVHEHMAARGLDLKKLTIVPHGVDVDEWVKPPLELPATLRAEIEAARAEGCAVIGYAGSMGQPNALDTLLDAVHEWRSSRGDHTPRLRVILVGDGHERSRLQQRLLREGLQEVRWHPPIPKRAVPSFLASIDVAYIGWQPVPLYRFGIAPNKLMDYLMAGCVVLHSVDAGNDPVAESGCGLTVPPGDPKAVALGLRHLLTLSRPARLEMGRRGQAHVRDHHAYPVLARRFLKQWAPESEPETAVHDA